MRDYTYSVPKKEDNDLGPIGMLHKITVEQCKCRLGEVSHHAM